jgi:hypothetical protein
MKQDTYLKILRPAAIGITVLFTSACSQAPETTAPSGKPKHVWSDQVEALHEAKEVANYANELQAIQEGRLRERNGER